MIITKGIINIEKFLNRGFNDSRMRFNRGIASVKENLRPDAGVCLVCHVCQVNPTASCHVLHASHVPYIVQCVSNHAMRQVHQVPEKYSAPIYSLQSAIGITAVG